jgi:geranylgeranylglycerol-phosphate geranylgeranyltransferase
LNTVYYHIKLFRPLNVFIAGLAMIIASAIMGTLHEIEIVLIVMLVVMSFAAAANALNDVVDVEIDRINRPMRPIPSGNVKKKFSTDSFVFTFYCGNNIVFETS